MSAMPKPIEWAPPRPMSPVAQWVLPQYGMQEMYSGDAWAVLKRYQWSQYEPTLVTVTDSRDAAIGFVKLLQESDV